MPSNLNHDKHSVKINFNTDNAVGMISCFLLNFAEDTKGQRKANNTRDAAKFQNDFDNRYRWSIDWQMLFNLDKCHILHFGKTNPHYQYYINNHPMLQVDKEKDLGVMIDDDRSCAALAGK